MDDDHSVRLEAEWTRPKRSLDLVEIHKRFVKSLDEELQGAAKDSLSIEDLPSGWSAVLYTMSDKRRLLVGFLLAPGSTLFCLFRIHFQPGHSEDPRDVIKLITSSFRIHEGETVPWVLYDMSLIMPSDFRLASTKLEAGRKLLVFQWRLRKFYTWYFSLADIMLRDRTLGEWSADFLNASKEIKGPKFVPSDNDGMHVRHGWPHFIGHSDEIGRLCFRYKIGYRHDAENNRIILWVYNYRKLKDLEKIAHVSTD